MEAVTGVATVRGLAPRTALDKGLLSSQVYEALRAEIVAGALSPGERLVESEIARTFDVSQAPVRDALRQLAHEGLVLQLPRRGSFVASISEDEARRSYLVREPLEGVAAQEFCEHAPDSALDELQGHLDTMFAVAETGNLPALIDADMAFHRVIWTASSNPLLPRIFPMVEAVARNFTAISNRLYFNEHEIAASHRPLLDSLRQRDPDTAVRLHRQHVREVWQRIQRGMETSS